MSNSSEKVYCKDCKWLNITLSYYSPFQNQENYLCEQPKNKEVIDDFLSREEHYIWTPEEKNENNDCEYFFRKPSLLKRVFGV